jgi:hypothetical protein
MPGRCDQNRSPTQHRARPQSRSEWCN